MTESRKIRAQCNQANAVDIRDGLSATETAMATKLDQWNELAVKTTEPDEDYHNELKVANEEAQSNVEALTEALSQADKALADLLEKQKRKSLKDKN